MVQGCGPSFQWGRNTLTCLSSSSSSLQTPAGAFSWANPAGSERTGDPVYGIHAAGRRGGEGGGGDRRDRRSTFFVTDSRESRFGTDDNIRLESFIRGFELSKAVDQMLPRM